MPSCAFGPFVYLVFFCGFLLFVALPRHSASELHLTKHVMKVKPHQFLASATQARPLRWWHAVPVDNLRDVPEVDKNSQSHLNSLANAASVGYLAPAFWLCGPLVALISMAAIFHKYQRRRVVAMSVMAMGPPAFQRTLAVPSVALTSYTSSVEEPKTLSKTVHFGGCSLKAKDIVAIAQWLGTNSTLRALDLSGNQIDDDGATLLAHALLTNSTLEDLNLSDNSFGDDGCLALADIMGSNTTLRTLRLEGMKFKLDTINKLEQLLIYNTSLTQLTCSPLTSPTKPFLSARQGIQASLDWNRCIWAATM